MSSTKMTNTTKTLKVLGLIVLIAAIYGGYVFPKAQLLVGATAGSTYSTQKSAQIIWSPATASATTTSILNTDSSSRVIESFTSYCDTVGSSNGFLTGGGISAWSWTLATSSVAGNLVGNTNYALNTTISTSTAQFYVASTTPGSTGSPFIRVWGPNTYLVWSANATNTATCNVGVNYLSY